MLARYSSIFSALILLFIATAAAAQFHWSGIVIVIALALVAVSGVYVASGRRHAAWMSVIAAVVWMGLLVLHNRAGSHSLLIASSIGGALFIGMTIRLMLHHIFRSKNVQADLLFGAASIYLMFALLWTFIYNIIEELAPSAFTGSPHDFYSLLYFSLTTLTTLGYGDISPKEPMAQIASVLEATLGVLYTAIMVARLMGLHLAGGNDTPADDETKK